MLDESELGDLLRVHPVMAQRVVSFRHAGDRRDAALLVDAQRDDPGGVGLEREMDEVVHRPHAAHDVGRVGLGTRVLISGPGQRGLLATAVAREAGAVPEVLGDAGLLLRAEDGLPVAAEALHLAVSDEGLRASLRASARERLAAYDHERVAGRLRAALEAAAA